MSLLNKKTVFVLTALASSVLLAACNSSAVRNQNIDLSQKAPAKISSTLTQPVATPTITVAPTVHQPVNGDVLMNIKTDYGNIEIKLYGRQTPNTVANFVDKVNSGFYDNLTFHRVESDFVVQGGDPLGNGTGGASIKSELNSIPFKKGSVGLARTPLSREISNDSQFFICLTTEACSQLTGDYVNFGEVVSGFENVLKIKVGDKIIKITPSNK